MSRYSRSAVGVALSALLLWSALCAAASGFLVSRAWIDLRDGVWMLNAQVDYIFSDSVLEALDNGVPLTLEVRVQVRRAGAWIWEASLVDQRHLYWIRYQPLSELYKVRQLPSGQAHTFVTRTAAISHLGEIDGLRLLEPRKLDPDKHYVVRIKASLDIEALPLPLRPAAYLKPSWSLSSGWTEWPLSE